MVSRGAAGEQATVPYAAIRALVGDEGVLDTATERMEGSS